MTLIKSISGIRGTIGGKAGDCLTPVDVVKFASAFGTWVLARTNNPRIVVGRDARLSGDTINALVCSTLQNLGIDVIDLDMATTPTVEIAVPEEKAGGGIIITASHNPKEWNALKLLNDRGEFISAEDGQTILKLADEEEFMYVKVNELGTYEYNDTYEQKHIDKILALPLVDVEAIQKKDFKIVIDCVNSVGGLVVPKLLNALGVEQVKQLYCEPTGQFPHNPEPLPEHLYAIAGEVKLNQADLGIVVDPDVDRLALVCEDTSMFGEEYTLVAIADYVLQHKQGNTVSNLSSTRALKDITLKRGGDYHASAVGEVNVVQKMKEVGAVIGGEGNGGVIYPDLHYGRDALVGIALFLSHLAKSGKTASILRRTYPNYYMFKNKLNLTEGIDVDAILHKIQQKYDDNPVNTVDGVKIDFDGSWVHLRKSNTEPIIRIYTEGTSENIAKNLAEKLMTDIREFVKSGAKLH